MVLWRNKTAKTEADRPDTVPGAIARSNGIRHEPHVLRYPGTSLGQLLDQSADRFGDVPAIVYAESQWSYRELRTAVNRLAGGLASLGIRRGDRVLMTLPNCPEFITAFFAVSKLAAVVVNAGPLVGVDDLKRIFEMTRPKLVIALDLQAEILSDVHGCDEDDDRLEWLWISLKRYQTVWKKLGYQAKLAQSRPRNGLTSHGRRLSELMDASPPRPPTVAPAPASTAVLQPTGGTTGVLKVAQLTHANLMANAMQLTNHQRPRAGQERMLGILPMFHVYGLSTCLVTAVFNAATMIPITRFRISVLLDAIVRHQPTILPLAPAIIEPICQALEDRARQEVLDVVNDATVTSGAAPLGVETSHRFERLTGVRIVQGYGLTEASPVTHANPVDAPRPGSIGKPLADTDVRLVDLADPDQPAEPGAPGHMLITGPQIMDGYFENPEETGCVLSVDDQGRPWLATGDIARIDEDGYTFIVDRLKDMINCGGLKVYPRKVEVVLNREPRIRDCAVVGREDAVKSQAVAAIIVLEQPIGDIDTLIAELRHYCRLHLAPYEVPTHFEFVDELPRTALGKLQKFRLQPGAPRDGATPQENAAPQAAEDTSDPQ
ncbi:MAG: hypothetical protein CMJ18_00910 [Phycisphaeraceae bacterium]|nr:hypothetical protein [Phycisphaeraceae bacterium]